MSIFCLLLACETSKPVTTDSGAQSEPSSSPGVGEPSSTDPTACSTGDVRDTSRSCGEEGEGTEVDVCQDGEWTESRICLLHEADSVSYPRADIFAGYFPAEWEYGDNASGRIHGWSYYIRAFDLIQDQPVKEVGWGQWTKPNAPEEGLDVCGIHPHGFTCEGMEPGESEVENCGHTDYNLLEDCSVWCCGEEDKCGVRGSIEGGMGYWKYTLESQHVKWMMPASTNMNYEIFGGTFGHEGPKPCTQLGGAVRISNQLLVPNDFFSFSGEKIDGFVGYMLSRTPIGKRSDTDNANHWTIIIDTANYSGPALYMAPWFWDSRINWHPQSVSWSDPRALIGYIAEGFEGGMGYIEATDEEGNRWFRTNKWALPQDTENGSPVETSTLFTGHSQYNEDWAVEAMEPLLSGSGSEQERSFAHIRTMGAAKRNSPQCVPPDSDAGFEVGIEESGDELLWQGFGVGSISAAEATSPEQQSAGCSTTLTVDPNVLQCENGWCSGSSYLQLDSSGTTRIVNESDVPDSIKNTLQLREFVPNRRNDGRYLGPPAETEEACFQKPGPADDKLYCTRTENGVWLGFQWYRFVDQPELNQVFASLPEEQRDAAKCYMQERIERLHAAQNDSQDTWFEAPQGQLPKEKAALDPAFLVTPPAGMEVGYVPISVFERKREKPTNCDVVVGAYSEEPEPLPANYYEGFVYEAGEYDQEVCESNPESGSEFSYPGIIFGYPTGTDPFDRHAYSTPLKADVGSVLSAQSPVCGLPSDRQ